MITRGEYSGAEISVGTGWTLKEFNNSRSFAYGATANMNGLGYPAYSGSGGHGSSISSVIYVLKGSDQLDISASVSLAKVKALTIKLLTTLPA
ncbi:MAG: hypothetical protein ACYDEP_01260 [Acidimicrobiales bacterium]